MSEEDRRKGTEDEANREEQARRLLLKQKRWTKAALHEKSTLTESDIRVQMSQARMPGSGLLARSFTTGGGGLGGTTIDLDPTDPIDTYDGDMSPADPIRRTDMDPSDPIGRPWP